MRGGLSFHLLIGRGGGGWYSRGGRGITLAGEEQLTSGGVSSWERGARGGASLSGGGGGGGFP